MVMWPCAAALPSGCIEAGQSLSTTTYAALFALYGYTHGGSGATFGTPSMHRKFPRGTTTVGEVGAASGADTFTLATANMPAHTHTMDHYHTMNHDHSIGHFHGNITTSSDGFHRHDVLRPPYAATGGRATQFAPSTSPGAGSIWAVSSLYDPLPNNQLVTDYHFGHAHFVDIPYYNGNSGISSTSITGSPSNATTGSTGSATSVSNVPASVYTRYIIRASAG